MHSWLNNVQNCSGSILIMSCLCRKDTRLSPRYIFAFWGSLGTRLVYPGAYECCKVAVHKLLVYQVLDCAKTVGKALSTLSLEWHQYRSSGKERSLIPRIHFAAMFFNERYFKVLLICKTGTRWTDIVRKGFKFSSLGLGPLPPSSIFKGLQKRELWDGVTNETIIEQVFLWLILFFIQIC